VCAQEALWRIELDSVLLVPVGEPPHRAAASDPGRERRYELCRAAVDGDDRLEVSRIEIDRDGPSYTVDTLRALRRRSPGEELHLLMGADQAVTLGDWREPEEVLRLARVAVAARGSVGEEDVRSAIAELGGGERVSFFEMPRIDVSSTMIRERRARREPIKFLVPEKVARLIDEWRLYTEGSA
jgi:nicotinate-nucleotide adenylyltransferase